MMSKAFILTLLISFVATGCSSAFFLNPDGSLSFFGSGDLQADLNSVGINITVNETGLSAADVQDVVNWVNNITNQTNLSGGDSVVVTTDYSAQITLGGHKKTVYFGSGGGSSGSSGSTSSNSGSNDGSDGDSNGGTTYNETYWEELYNQSNPNNNNNQTRDPEYDYETPEFTTIGAMIALVGAFVFIFRKRN